MIRYSLHASRRLVERGISPGWVEKAVLQPDWVRPDMDPVLTHSFKAIPEREGRILKVVHRRDGQDILIVTLHLDRGAAR